MAVPCWKIARHVSAGRLGAMRRVARLLQRPRAMLGASGLAVGTATNAYNTALAGGQDEYVMISIHKPLGVPDARSSARYGPCRISAHHLPEPDARSSATKPNRSLCVGNEYVP